VGAVLFGRNQLTLPVWQGGGLDEDQRHPADALTRAADTADRPTQLLCVAMEYLNPELDEFLERCNAVVLRHELPRFPAEVADAMNILRHVKIGRWVSRSWVWAEDPEYDKEAGRFQEGSP